MRIAVRLICKSVLLLSIFCASSYGSKPHVKPLCQLQQEFLDLRFGLFIHFNMATYQEREWALADVSPAVFNPAKLDCDQWAKAAQSANMTYGLLTTKHLDGFCLWNTETTEHSVKNSLVKKDIVGEYADAFRRHGLKVCLYFSILDRHEGIETRFITPEDIEFIKKQLTELLTNYGEITAILFDSWDVDWARISYEEVPFREIYDHIKNLQPNCLVSEHNVSTYPYPALFYTDIKHYEQNASQKLPPNNVIPAQSGPCLQSDWFWKASFPTTKPKNADMIVNEWLIPFNKSYCNLLLNVGINKEGFIDENALEELAKIGQIWKHPGPAQKLPVNNPQFTTANLALNKKSRSSSCFRAYSADLANDGDFETFWQGDINQKNNWIEVLFEKPTTFNTAHFISSSDQIASYKFQRWDGSKWVVIAEGEKTGVIEVVKFDAVISDRVRLSLESTKPRHNVIEIGIYNEPKLNELEMLQKKTKQVS